MNRLPFGIGDFVATFKGDYEGHPFRGNQWEGGGSGGEESSSDGGSSGDSGGGGELLPESEQTKILKSKREQTANELSDLKKAHANDTEIKPLYRTMNNGQLAEVHDRVLIQMKNNPSDEMSKQRLASIKKERDYRVHEAALDRRLSAIDEGISTGKLTVSESEMVHMINNQGDAYRDAGWNGKGKPPYNPELFHRSDLSGKPVRHYVTLPDGRKAHPDELTLSRKRGRVVVVPNTV